MLKLFWKVLKDERGIIPAIMALAANPAVQAGAVSLGSTILGGLGKKKKTEEVIDPYAAQRSQLTNYLSGKLGTSTKYQFNPEFQTDQPEVEAATQKTILGKLNAAPQMSADLKASTQQSYDAQKARLAEEGAQEVKDTQNMYNRLGLSSSTPGLQAVSDVGRKQNTQLGEISAQLTKDEIANEMQRTELENNITSGWASQGNVLGSQQRGYQQNAMNMSESDIARQTAEEQNYANMMSGLIGQPTTRITEEPNIWENLGLTGQDIGTQMMLKTILGKK